MAAKSPLAAADSIESADGTKLAYRAWPKPGAAITFAAVHGFAEHSGRYAPFAEGMARHNIGSFAIDLRGHGMSPGQRGHVDSWSQWTDDVAAFVKHVEGVTGGEVIPIGHSFGGMAVLSTVLAGKVPNSKRFVVSAPALKLKLAVPAWKLTLNRLTAGVMPRLAMSNELDPRTLSRIPEVVEAYRSDPLVHRTISNRMFGEWENATREILARAGEIKVPFLILAGTDDALVDPAGSRQLHEQAPAMSEFQMLEGRYHEPFNDIGSEEVFQLIADWLRKN
ncbi:MAG: lysophospholipase [Candidatus Dormibacteraeota bacterium]|nr:lysophospholipase [Candidatus Dormibacteraeota bacterium]